MGLILLWPLVLAIALWALIRAERRSHDRWVADPARAWNVAMRLAKEQERWYPAKFGEEVPNEAP